MPKKHGWEAEWREVKEKGGERNGMEENTDQKDWREVEETEAEGARV